MDDQSELRRCYVAEHRTRQRAIMLGMAAGLGEWEAILQAPRIDYGPYAELHCGARGKRLGVPCRIKAIYANGRCRFHGGLSTGPKSIDGKARSAMNVRREGKPTNPSTSNRPSSACQRRAFTVVVTELRRATADSPIRRVLSYLAGLPWQTLSLPALGRPTSLTRTSARWAVFRLTADHLVRPMPAGEDADPMFAVTWTGRRVHAALQEDIPSSPACGGRGTPSTIKRRGFTIQTP